jgi:hypothetical protein
MKQLHAHSRWARTTAFVLAALLLLALVLMAGEFTVDGNPIEPAIYAARSRKLVPEGESEQTERRARQSGNLLP